MFNRRLLILAAFIFLFSSPVIAGEEFQPRVEGNWRYSNDRSIYMSEFWVPLAQNTEDGSVLFGDVRLMGDNNDNKEFNVGAGYREAVDTALLGEGIAGAMVWFDRRRSARGSKFNQVTVGGEWLGADWDVRVNGYIPFNDSKTHTQANPNGSGSGFVGNQLLVNTDQTVSEEALKGVDLELGYKLGFLDGVTDATRIYAGGYHFEGDRAEDVSGWRTRFTSDITQDIQIGARYQHDDVRGSQTYLEATIRFPFGNKKSYQEHGLRSRLDESPERDIDIVSNEAVIDAGLTNTQLLNAQTGLVQNIIHVDNTNGAGTGTAADPFNTLAAAQAAAGVNDLIYVHRGDGTTTGMNAGITLNDAGQMLAGSGADLEFNTDRFRVSGGGSISQPIIAATSAPVITNGGGAGVLINADDVFVSGITIDAAATSGINMFSDSNIEVDGVHIKNSGGRGINFNALVADVSKLTVKNSVVENSGSYGIFLNAKNGFTLSDVSIRNNVVKNGSSMSGLQIVARDDGSKVRNIEIVGNDFSNQSFGDGILVISRDNSLITGVNVKQNEMTNNFYHGFEINIVDNGSVENTTFKKNSVFDNINVDIRLKNTTALLNLQENWWGTQEGLTRIDADGPYDASYPLFFDPNL